jgi:signal transduction histidine kinase
MSGARAQLALETLPDNRSLLPMLLHALNQPLTGLQCSLELAASGSRRPEQYIRTLREGLVLASRMRILVEAIREVIDARQQEAAAQTGESFLLDSLLCETVDDLRPVGEARSVQLSLACEVPLPVEGNRAQTAALLFRLLESALSLTRDGAGLRIAATSDGQRAIVLISWTTAPPPEFSPFSRSELGLIVAQAGWEQAGARWASSQVADTQSCTLQLPLSHSGTPEGANGGAL